MLACPLTPIHAPMPSNVIDPSPCSYKSSKALASESLIVSTDGGIVVDHAVNAHFIQRISSPFELLNLKVGVVSIRRSHVEDFFASPGKES